MTLDGRSDGQLLRWDHSFGNRIKQLAHRLELIVLDMKPVESKKASESKMDPTKVIRPDAH